VSVPCFLLFLCFRKVTHEIFSELDETKAEVPNYLTRRRSPKESRRWTRGQPHLLVARAPLGHATRGCDRLVHPLTSPFRLFNPLDGKTLEARTLFQKTYCKPPPSSPRYREGQEALPGTLLERGITTGGLLHHPTCYLYLWRDTSSELWTPVHSFTFILPFTFYKHYLLSCKQISFTT
jgi:hypothetical protein